MKIKQFEIWIADLNPRMGTEAGKIRPVIVVQTDLLNKELSRPEIGLHDLPCKQYEKIR